MKLSPSTLNLFIECPRCFWLQMNKNVKRPAGVFPSLPSGMDGVLKKYFDRFIGQGTLPMELNALKGYRLFDDKEKLKAWRSNLKGLEYTHNGVLLHGAVDNILIHGKKLVVLDYKTRGYPCKEDTHSHYINQMNLYNYLLRKNGYETEDYAYLLFYHPLHVEDNGLVKFETTLIKVDISVHDGEKVFLDAIKCLSNDIPGDTCEWCVCK